MAEAFIYNNAGNLGPNGQNMYPPKQYGIFFQLTSSYYRLSSIKVKLGNYGNPTGVLTANLYAMTGGYTPTGPVLATGAITQGSIANFASVWTSPYAAVGALYEITFDTQVILVPVSAGGGTYIITLATSFQQLGSNFTAGLWSSPTWLYGPNGLAGHAAKTTGVWFNWLTASPIFELWGTVYVPRNPARPDADLPDFPDDRPDSYVPDDFWIPGKWDGDTYTPPEWGPPTNGRYFATGGGRWGQQLVAVGHGLIYYEELT